MIKVYQGDLECDFELSAERFIVKEKSISFELNGSDEYGAFKVSGDAKLENSKYYIAQNLELNYREYTSDDRVKIAITSLMESETICTITGTWTQEGDDFEFSGNLKKWVKKA